MFNITINGEIYQIDEGLSIIDACDALGIKIPRFCYLKSLSVPANCRMCLVEVKGRLKLVPACHTLVSNNMEIFTESEKVKSARKSIMAFLLINHPLDCPICDQAGECELQNQAVAFGNNDSYYDFEKRARNELYLGPLIYTSMTKCINCTRCVRFMHEIAGIQSLGILGRGEDSDISNYFQEPIRSELSGNLVDICPVGALNNAQYLYRDRPWQLTNTGTIDIIDPLCSRIIVNMEENEVVRILPIDYPNINTSWKFYYNSQNNIINEVEDPIFNTSNLWISDKTRYICDALNIQRLDTPWIRDGGKLRKSTFNEAFKIIYDNLINLTGKEIAALSGRFADVESMLLLKELMLSLDSDIIDCRLNNIKFTPKDRASYIFNSTVNGISEADCILIIGSNPKIEVPVLNAQIRQKFLKNSIPVGIIGEDINLNFPVEHLGNTLEVLIDVLNGNNKFSKILENSKKPMLIVGEGAFENQEYEEVQALLYALCNKFNIVNEYWNGYNFIHTSVGNIGGLDIGFINENYSVFDILNKLSSREIKFVWLLNVDELDFQKLENSFVVYIGHHGDKGAEHANIILPSALWLEKQATFVNIEGMVLQTSIAKKPPKEAKEDWKIFKAFSDFIGKPLPYNTLEKVRKRMNEVNDIFSTINVINNNSIEGIKFNKKLQGFLINNRPVSSIIKDYYLTDVISRNSSIMSKCSKLFNSLNKTDSNALNNQCK